MKADIQRPEAEIKEWRGRLSYYKGVLNRPPKGWTEADVKLAVRRCELNIKRLEEEQCLKSGRAE